MADPNSIMVDGKACRNQTAVWASPRAYPPQTTLDKACPGSSENFPEANPERLAL